MSNKQEKDKNILDEYDFSEGVRGKYIERLTGHKNIVILEPDVAEVFTDSKSVNDALRGLLSVIQKQINKVHQ